jgi:hypothetical protein
MYASGKLGTIIIHTVPISYSTIVRTQLIANGGLFKAQSKILPAVVQLLLLTYEGI